jgi:hypothetical protein
MSEPDLEPDPRTYEAELLAERQRRRQAMAQDMDHLRRLAQRRYDGKKQSEKMWGGTLGSKSS